MADEEQSAEDAAAPPSKKGRTPSYRDMVEERQHLKEAIGRQLAESEERTSSLLATLTSLSDEQKAWLATTRDAAEADGEQQRDLIGALENLVGALGALVEPAAAAAAGTDPANSPANPAPAGNGDGDASSQAAAEATETTSPDTATEVAAVTAEEGAEDEAGSTEGTTAGEEEPPGDAAGAPDEAPPDGETGEAEASAAAEGAEAEAIEEDASPGSAQYPSPGEIARALAERLPIGEIGTLLAAIRTILAKGNEEAEGRPTLDLQQIVEILAALRSDLEAQSQLIQALHRTPPPEKAPAALPADQAVKQHAEIMGHVDQLILRLADMLPGGTDEAPAAADDQAEGSLHPPPTQLDEVRTAAADLSTQLRVEGSAFRRFAWIAAGIAAVAIPMALALGIFVQREYALMPAADPTAGWKDLVWDDYGSAIAECRGLENAGVGECVITIAPPDH